MSKGIDDPTFFIMKKPNIEYCKNIKCHLHTTKFSFLTLVCHEHVYKLQATVCQQGIYFGAIHCTFLGIFGKLDTFPSNLLKFYIFFSISKKGPKPFFLKFTPFIVLAKRVTIYVFLLCKLFGQKIRFCKIFDKFQVCL